MPVDWDEPTLRSNLAMLARRTEAMVGTIELLFVTSVRQGALVDVGPTGIVNTAQSYSRDQADEIIRSLQDTGVTVRPFFDEAAFAQFVLDAPPTEKVRIAYTTAEGGVGPGRRALVPALCDFVGLPILQSPAHASVLARHKFHANAVLQRAGLRVPETWIFERGGWGTGGRPADGQKVIIKPVWESMCIGVDDESVQLVSPAFDAFMTHRSERLGQPLVAQEFISGDEVGVPVVRIGEPRALPPVAFLRGDGKPFDDRPKTFQDEVVRHNTSLAAFESDEVSARALAHAAQSAFAALEMAGAARIDFRVDRDGRAWIFDTNEAPPPLPNTSWALAAELSGLTFRDMLVVWLGAALSERGLL